MSISYPAAPRVFAAGLVVLDVLRVADTPERVSCRVGGTAGNVAAILGALGLPVALVGPEDGTRAYTLIREDLERCGVQYHGVHDTVVPVIVEHLAHHATHQFLFNCPVCGRALPRYRRNQHAHLSTHAFAPSAEVFFTDRLSDEILTFAHAAKRQGAFVVYEPSDPTDAPWTVQMLGLADMVKYSAERAPTFDWMSEGDFLEIRTRGAQGLQWRWRGEGIAEWQSMAAVGASRVVDTCGAGDWLTSGILIGLLEHRGAWDERVGVTALHSILENAQQLAAWSCGYAGARGALYESGPSVARAIVRPSFATPATDPLPESAMSHGCLACPD